MLNAIRVKTLLKLGLFNILRIVKYRLSTKFSLNSLYKIEANLPSGNFFIDNKEFLKEELPQPTKMKAFGFHIYEISSTSPNWMFNPLTGTTCEESNTHWYNIPDFNDQVGDIKGIWEASRLDWVLDFIKNFKEHNNQQSLYILEHWLNDWCAKNPAYLGPNWKCGQEASIRVMHLISALIGLDQLDQPSDNILTLLEIHLKRIVPTIDYAIAQNNNHGTSEATALFIGGGLLNSITPKRKYQSWESLGRKWLENRAKKLIMDDGGFSQYSTNYHRVMLDSYSLAEIVRQKLNLKEFSSSLYQQLKKATDWLYVLTQENGDAPNLGANDGARLLPVSETDYRDFRPSVQLASTLFTDQSYYKNNDAYDESLIFFKVKKKNLTISNLPNKNQFFNRSGLITAQQADLFLAFKLPIYKFKPSQCDALHLDLWLRGKNILRDGGTFSYNSTNEDFEYFGGVRSHNTIQFDNREQMPRLRRFLLGAWLSPKRLQYFSKNKFSCGYRDYLGAEHFREIFFTENYLEVKDSVQGFKDFAILRWRLNPGQWILNDHKLTDRLVEISIQAEHPITLKLVEGQESRYYYQKTSIPVLEVIISKPTTVTSTIKVLI
ncbi:alginate lyase family protein [Acinetobacter indicus]|uniref:alginate lyase family protein n=1 Tax=Acinetobacter indicus TaxID=756892 RepID=UPI002575A0AC|nr:alginate lyase family protein [Acinetobacter indicus]MDM1245254.1 alginate lyase family protein [Acinetobacter indicus]MDM1289307.1 alginate lyase family protein [Acinetobacter indicus]